MYRKKTTTRASGWKGNWTTIRDIEVICAVVAERKTTGAALRLGISQPSVSRAISNIENRLGKPLFHREGGRLVATAAALDFYEQGSKMFDSFAHLTKSRSDPMSEGSVSILAPPTIASFYLSAEVALFAAAHPKITMSLDIAMSHEVPDAIAEGRAHLGMMDGHIFHSGVATDLFLATSAVCCLPQGHHLARKRMIDAADLHDVAYIAVNRRHSLRGRLDRLFAEAQVSPRVVAQTDLMTLAMDFVCKGLGVSVLNPFPLMLHRTPGMVIRRFTPTLEFDVNFVVPAHEALPSPARHFIDLLKSTRKATLEATMSGTGL